MRAVLFLLCVSMGCGADDDPPFEVCGGFACSTVCSEHAASYVLCDTQDRCVCQLAPGWLLAASLPGDAYSAAWSCPGSGESICTRDGDVAVCRGVDLVVVFDCAPDDSCVDGERCASWDPL